MSEERRFQMRPPRQRRELVLPIALAAAAALLVMLAVLVVYPVWYQFHYRDFVAAFSDSTTYAYHSDSLHARSEGWSSRVTGENDYHVYALLTDEPGRLRRSVPEEEPGVVLDYGDGATLELWEVELTDVSARQPDGVLWRFVSAEGETWIYDSDAVRYQKLLLTVDILHNEAWE